MAKIMVYRTRSYVFTVGLFIINNVLHDDLRDVLHDVHQTHHDVPQTHHDVPQTLNVYLAIMIWQ